MWSTNTFLNYWLRRGVFSEFAKLLQLYQLNLQWQTYCRYIRIFTRFCNIMTVIMEHLYFKIRKWELYLETIGKQGFRVRRVHSLKAIAAFKQTVKNLSCVLFAIWDTVRLFADFDGLAFRSTFVKPVQESLALLIATADTHVAELVGNMNILWEIIETVESEPIVGM